MSAIRIQFYVVKRNGRAFWQPSASLKRRGFSSVPLGPDGPEAWAKAALWNERAATPENGLAEDRASYYPIGSLGDWFQKFQTSEAWASKQPKSREDYHRCWPLIELNGYSRKLLNKITPGDSEDFHRRLHAREAAGELSASTRYRVLKVWRSLLNAAATYGVIPSAPIGKVPNPQPAGRSEFFLESEITRLIEVAEAQGRQALALGIAIAYDAGLSPVDVRLLTADCVKGAGTALWIETKRKKTGADQKHALSAETCALIARYLTAVAAAGVELAPAEPLLRQPDGWRPYPKDRWEKHFRWARETALPGDTRRMLDIRRTANVEADLGGISREDRAELLGNNLHKSSFLEATYTPATVARSRQSLDKRKAARTLLEAEAQALKQPSVGTRESEAMESNDVPSRKIA